jgi:hypothetical protein
VGGVERGERCIYIGDALTIDDLLAHGAATDGDRDRGALFALPGREPYLRDGRFEPDAMLEQWGTWYAASRQQGFAGLRVSGSASWALNTDMDFSGFIEYEARLNDFLPATGARVMCHYEFGAFQPGIIRDVLPCRSCATTSFDRSSPPSPHHLILSRCRPLSTATTNAYARSSSPSLSSSVSPHEQRRCRSLYVNA